MENLFRYITTDSPIFYVGDVFPDEVFFRDDLKLFYNLSEALRHGDEFLYRDKNTDEIAYYNFKAGEVVYISKKGYIVTRIEKLQQK